MDLKTMRKRRYDNALAVNGLMKFTEENNAAVSQPTIQLK